MSEDEMSTGLDVFDTTVQQTNLWLKDIMDRLGTSDRHLAYQVLRATLHMIRNRVGPEPAVHFGAQLPMLIRGLYYEGWHMTDTATRTRILEDFLDDIEYEARRDLGADRKEIVKAVFQVIASRIDPCEVNKLIKVFPENLKALWIEDGVSGWPRRNGGWGLTAQLARCASLDEGDEQAVISIPDRVSHAGSRRRGGPISLCREGADEVHRVRSRCSWRCRAGKSLSS
jgi:uncharacterized protein (DUF2267 family)